MVQRVKKKGGGWKKKGGVKKKGLKGEKKGCPSYHIMGP